MCRLFGFRAGRPSLIHEPLVVEKNALMHQSVEHPDGWGIGFYRGDGPPTVIKAAGAAFKDDDFARNAQLVSSDCVVAHVRKASVGPVRVENSHPFALGRWLFAHNGTVAGFDASRAELESRIAPHLRSWVGGDTDSERCGALLFGELAARGHLDDPDYPAERAAAALREAVRTVRAICDRQEEPSRLTYLLTNGRLLLGCRVGRELYLSVERGESADTRVMLASEKISSRDRWSIVPEDGVVVIDGALRVFRGSLHNDALEAEVP